MTQAVALKEDRVSLADVIGTTAPVVPLEDG
jgi:hypothetical protein